MSGIHTEVSAGSFLLGFSILTLEPRSLASFGIGPGFGDGVSPARRRSVNETPSVLSPPSRSHSRRETRSANEAVWSCTEIMVPPAYGWLRASLGRSDKPLADW